MSGILKDLVEQLVHRLQHPARRGPDRLRDQARRDQDDVRAARVRRPQALPRLAGHRPATCGTDGQHRGRHDDPRPHLGEGGHLPARSRPGRQGDSRSRCARRPTTSPARSWPSSSPGCGTRCPSRCRALVVARAQAETPNIVREVLTDIQRDPDAVFDLKDMVITNLVTDKALLNRIFQEAGRKEFRFIARSGIWFGGTIGLLQMTLWVLFHQPLDHAGVRPDRRLVHRLARPEADLQSEASAPHPRHRVPGPVPQAPQGGRGRLRRADRRRDHHAAQGDRGRAQRAAVRPGVRDDPQAGAERPRPRHRTRQAARRRHRRQRRGTRT